MAQNSPKHQAQNTNEVVNPKHRAELQASAISQEIIDWNFESIDDDKRVSILLNWKSKSNFGSGWVVYNSNIETGERVLDGLQVKLDCPRIEVDKKSGKPVLDKDGNPRIIRYESRYGSASTPLFLRHGTGADEWWQVLANPEISVLVTEGGKKCASGLSHGYKTIGLSGIWNAQKLDRLHPDLARYCERGRRVYLIPDSDLQTNPHVEAAVQCIAPLIRYAGAIVHIVLLPIGEDGKKMGLDDFLAKYGSEAFQQLLDSSPTYKEWLDQLEQDQAECEEDEEADKAGGKNQAGMLVDLTRSFDLKYFHSPENKPYADLTENGIRAALPLDSGEFEDWLSFEFCQKFKSVPNKQSLQGAIGVLSHQARRKSPMRELYVRYAEVEGALYIDIGDETWRAIKVTAAGVQIVSNPPVRFKRDPNILPLPIPVEGGSIQEFKDLFSNLVDEDWPLYAANMLFALFALRPHPTGCYTGYPGSCKSNLAWAKKYILDPISDWELGEELPERGDLGALIDTHWLCVFDNLNNISKRQLSTLCKFATGGNLSVRKFYKNRARETFSTLRPADITTVYPEFRRPENLRRILMFHTQKPKGRKLSEAEVQSRVEEMRPRVLGALLRAASAALKYRNRVEYTGRFEMVDFAKTAIAAETALGFAKGTMAAALERNVNLSNRKAVEDNPIAECVLELLKHQNPWVGAKADLYRAICQIGEGKLLTRDFAWPRDTSRMMRLLNEVSPVLAESGVFIADENTNPQRFRTNQQRFIELTNISTDTNKKVENYCHLLSPETEPIQDKDLSGDSKGDTTGISDTTVVSPNLASPEVVSPENPHQESVSTSVTRGDSNFPLSKIPIVVSGNITGKKGLMEGFVSLGAPPDKGSGDFGENNSRSAVIAPEKPTGENEFAGLI